MQPGAVPGATSRRAALRAPARAHSSLWPSQLRRARLPAASDAEPYLAPDQGLEAFKALIGQRRFTCTQCGKCCTGDGEVWITDREAANIAAWLHLPLKRFLAAHTRAYSKVKGFRMLQANLGSEARECTFLRPDNTCAIHPVRPLQCSTYPWWPDLMAEADWAWEREHVCEGFDHADAPPTDLDEAARQLRLATALECQKLLATKPSRKAQDAAAAAGVGLQQSSAVTSLRADASSAPPAAAVAWQDRLQGLQQLAEETDAT